MNKLKIAERLRGLRDVLELSVDTLVEECELTKEEYLHAERDNMIYPVRYVQK